MELEKQMLKRVEDSLKEVVDFNETLKIHGNLPCGLAEKLLVHSNNMSMILRGLENFNDKRIFVDHSDILAKDYEPKELLRSVQGTLNEMSKYLEWQEDNLNIISEDDVKKMHLRMSQQVAQTWVKVRDWNEKGAHRNDALEEIKTQQPLDIDKQAEIKTPYGSMIVIGKDQDEVTKEFVTGYGYKHMGYCHKCDAATFRTKVTDILPFAGEGGMRVEFECEECAQEIRDIRERNAYVNRMHKENNSQLF